MRHGRRPNSSRGNAPPRRAANLVLRREVPGTIRGRAGAFRGRSRRRLGCGSPSHLADVDASASRRSDRIHLSLSSRSAQRRALGLSRMRNGARGAGARTGAHRVRLPHAPARSARRPGYLPGVRHGAGAKVDTARRSAESGAPGHAPTARRRMRAEPAGSRHRHERDGAAARRAELARTRLVRMDSGSARHPGGPVVRMAVLRSGLDIDRHGKAQHVHAGGDGHGCRVAREHGRAAVPGAAPGGVSDRRGPPALLRSRRGHRDPGHPGPGAGARRPCAHRRRDPPPAHPRPCGCTADRSGRRGTGRSARPDRGWRHAAGSARGAGSDRRHVA